MFSTRFVYNSEFIKRNLYDTLYMQKLKSLCSNVKENVLFSDVKRNLSSGCKRTLMIEQSTPLCLNRQNN